MTGIAVLAPLAFTIPRMDYQDGKVRWSSKGLDELFRAIGEAINEGSPLIEQLRGRAANEIAERDRVRDANFALARDRWPIDAAIISRRDWQRFSLRMLFLIGAMAAIVALIIKDRFAEALQVFALVAGYFLGYGDRGQPPGQPAEQEAQTKQQQR